MKKIYFAVIAAASVAIATIASIVIYRNHSMKCR